jgi:hypothetical protein
LSPDALWPYLIQEKIKKSVFYAARCNRVIAALNQKMPFTVHNGVRLCAAFFAHFVNVCNRIAVKMGFGRGIFDMRDFA